MCMITSTAAEYKYYCMMMPIIVISLAKGPEDRNITVVETVFRRSFAAILICAAATIVHTTYSVPMTA